MSDVTVKEAQHTPGPWEFKDGFILANGEALLIVGTQTPMVVGPKRLEAICNARMAAAALDMHKALTELVDIVRGLLEDHAATSFLGGEFDPRQHIDSFTLQPAEMALAKAEGRK